MKVFYIKPQILLFIVFGIMASLGFLFGHISQSKIVVAPQKSEVAIVIDDFGGRAGAIEEMMNLPYPLNLQ